MHVIIVHFPIGLLFAVPVFAGLDLLFFKRNKTWGNSAFLLLAMGSLAAWAAVFSGGAAAHAANITDDVMKVLRPHAELGEWVRNDFHDPDDCIRRAAYCAWSGQARAPLYMGARRSDRLLHCADSIAYPPGERGVPWAERWCIDSG